METIDFSSTHHGDFRQWFVVHAFTKMLKEAQDRYMDDYKGKISLDFKINGEEINALEIIDEMERQYDAMTLESAKKLIEERLGDTFNYMEKVKRAMFDKLGIKNEEW